MTSISGIVIYVLHLVVFVGGVFSILLLVRTNRPAIELLAVGMIESVIAGWLTYGFTVRPVGDFRIAYYPAGKAVALGPHALLPLFEKKVFGFVNLPIVAWLFAPFSALELETAFRVFACIGLVVVGAAWWLLVRAARLDRNGAVLLLFLFSANGPLHYSFLEGNLSHVLLFPIVGAFTLLRSRRDFLAGALLGITAILKLPLLLFGAYFALRGRWRVILGGASAVAAVVTASLALFGWGLHATWIDHCLRPYAANPILAFNAQSIYAFIGRFEYGAASLYNWGGQPLSFPFRILASLGIGALYAAAIAAASRRSPFPVAGIRRLSGQTVTEIEFFVVLVLAIVGSPLSWSHYYVWLLIPTAFLIGGTDHFPDDAPTRWLAWAAVALVTLPVTRVYLSNPVLAEWFARSLASHLFLGAVLMLVVLLRSRWNAVPLVP